MLRKQPLSLHLTQCVCDIIFATVGTSAKMSAKQYFTRQAYSKHRKLSNSKKKFSILTVQQKNPLTFIYAKNAPKWLIFPTLLMLCVDKKSVVICIFESCLACPPPRVRNSVHNMITLSPFTFAFTIIMTKATHVPIYIQIFRSLFIADCAQCGKIIV